MEELLRVAFTVGQQWVHDITYNNEPIDFNTWYNSNTVQQQLKELNISINITKEELKEQITKIINNNNVYHHNTGEWGYNNDNAINELIGWLSKVINISNIKDCRTCKYNIINNKYIAPCYKCRDNGGYDNYESNSNKQ